MVELSGNDIARLIREAGVAGAGGAGFPTHVKASSSAGTVIANGAECEPLLDCDTALMIHNPKAVLDGLVLLGRATGAGELVIAIKQKNLQAIEAVERELVSPRFASSGIRLLRVGNFYPAGDEVSLVYEVTGRVPPEGGLPLDVGVVVQNVGTLSKIADAVEGKPFIRRFVTVAGEVQSPRTFDAPLGTSLKTLIQGAGGPKEQPFAIVVGGPCMGWAASSLDEPVTKTLTGVLVLRPDHPLIALKAANIDQLLHRAKSVCDQCRDCTDLCPRYLLGHRLEPHKLMSAIGWGNKLGSEVMREVHYCCECGVCGLYACPMGLYPHLYFIRIKQELNAAGICREKGLPPLPVHAEYQGRKLPAGRLRARLKLSGYAEHVPFHPEALEPDCVTLMLHQHTGAPSLPVVEAGRAVMAGDLIAEIPEGALGARVHASISGRVTEVTGDAIRIQAENG
ncbi:MAG: 4Fe-4S dicluster domain-containing protein [Planctomycetota bacterium]